MKNSKLKRRIIKEINKRFDYNIDLDCEIFSNGRLAWYDRECGVYSWHFVAMFNLGSCHTLTELNENIGKKWSIYTNNIGSEILIED